MKSHVNIGSGDEVTIRELAEIVKLVVGFNGKIAFDSSKPDGTMRKLMDVSILEKIGFSAKTDLSNGLQKTYECFKILQLLT